MFFVCSFAHIDKLKAQFPKLAEILSCAGKIASSPFKVGTEYIMGGNVRVNSEEVLLETVGCKKLEWHREFIDIHIPVSGEEILGWKPVEDIRHISTEYDSEKDIAFSDDVPSEYIRLKPGEFVIFNPSDAHSPCQGIGTHRKICVKVPVGYI